MKRQLTYYFTYKIHSLSLFNLTNSYDNQYSDHDLQFELSLSVSKYDSNK